MYPKAPLTGEDISFKMNMFNIANIFERKYFEVN